MERLPKYKIEEGRVHLRLVDDIDATRPLTRGDCANVERPCPFVGCRANLYLDVNDENGSIKFNFPDKEPDEVDPHRSCAIDIAERGGGTLEDIALLSNVTRERIRQIEGKALEQLRKSARLHKKSAAKVLREYVETPDQDLAHAIHESSGSVFAPAPAVERNEFDDQADDDAPPVAISFFADAGDGAVPLNDPAWDRTLRADEQYLARFHQMLARFAGREVIRECATDADETKKENTNMDASALPPRLAAVFKARNDLIAAGKEPTAIDIAKLANVAGSNDKARTANVYSAISVLKKKGFLDGAPKAAAKTSKPAPKKLPPPTAEAPRPSRTTSTNPTILALIEKRDGFRRKAEAMDIAIEALSEVL